VVRFPQYFFNMSAVHLVVLSSLIFLASLLTRPVLAQGLEQIAVNVEIEDFEVQEGMVVSVKEGKYSLAKADYDQGVYGVIVSDPALTLNKTSSTTQALVTNGQAQVLVSKKNGEIKTGDLVTTSKDKGIAQKATRSGHVLGKALSNFPDGKSSETGLIPVLININYNQVSAQSESLTQAGIDEVAKKISTVFLTGNLAGIFKYLFAILLGAISFFLGLNHFVRSNRTAVEAIARNPLAKDQIQRQLAFGNLTILSVSGLGLAVGLGILFFL